MKLFSLFCSILSISTTQRLTTFGLTSTNTVNDLSHLLEPIRLKYNAPAIGGLVLDVSGTLAIGSTGVRKLGSGVRVTSDDLWHLASNTKAMTATLVARLVEAGIVSWEDTLGKVYPSLDLRPELRSINFLHLLSHFSGIPENPDWHTLSVSHETLQGQRLNTVKLLNTIDLLSVPGTQFQYSNWAYTVAGAMLEQVTGETYEDLMYRELFVPLGMISAGFGPTSGNNEVTQPWGHLQIGLPTQHDNPLVMSPAGTVHCSLEDWAKFVRDHLRGEMGLAGILSVESYKKLHQVHFDPQNRSTLGWRHGSVGWALGPIFWHNGYNTYNYALMVVDPKGGVASIATTNKGGFNKMDQALNEVMTVMVEAVTSERM